MGEQSLKAMHTLALANKNNCEITWYIARHIRVNECILSNYNINCHLASKK